MSVSRVPPDELFRALDGHRLSLSDGDWDVCVFSVMDGDDTRWVQLALEGRAKKVLTLRLAPTHSSQHAFASLTCYLTDPHATSNVLSHVA